MLNSDNLTNCNLQWVWNAHAYFSNHNYLLANDHELCIKRIGVCRNGIDFSSEVNCRCIKITNTGN